MRTNSFEHKAKTTGPVDFVDLTEQIQHFLARSGFHNAQVTISCPAGCSLVVNELESGLLEDIRRVMAKVDRATDDGASRIGSASVVLPGIKGRLQLGTWQRVLLVELERGTERTVTIQIVGE
ncbi:MAG: YjbQ family protein [Actinomycetota bacterium]|nr:YjbQ family protein [Actinomycetota bacterium]